MTHTSSGNHLPIALASLGLTGACLGLSTNLAKVASDLDLSAPAYLAWSILGAALALLAIAASRRRPPPVTGRTLEYFLVSAFVTVAGPNLIIFLAVGHIGAGFVTLVITLPPLLTYVGALLLKMEGFGPTRAAGVLAALTGAGILAAEKLATPEAPAYWILVAFMAPVLLAIGNLYRTLRWPAGVSADALAPGMMIAAAAMLLLVGLLPGYSLAIPPTPEAAGLVLLQSVVFTAQFLLLFVLQRSGGPVLLSLLGAVGAVVGIPVAVFVLGEAPPGGLAAGAALIALGILLVARGNVRASRQR